MDKIADKYRVIFLNAESFIYLPQLENVRKFVEAIGNYANSVNEGFDALRESNNPMCMLHLQRMLADVCLKAYGLVYVNLDQTDAYINQFFTGSPKTIRKNGKDVSNATLKHQIKETLPIVAEVYSAANDYIHFSPYYYHNFLEDKSDFDFSSLFTEESINDATKKMTELNNALVDILNQILQKYAFKYPFAPHPDYGYQLGMNIVLYGICKVNKETGEKTMHFRAKLSDVYKYYESLYDTLQNAINHQIRKADRFGEERIYRVENTCSPLLAEVDRMGELLGGIKEQVERECKCLNDYSVNFVTYHIGKDPLGGDMMDIDNPIYPDKFDLVKENLDEAEKKCIDYIKENGIEE